MQAEFSVKIGPFLDTVQQRQVSVVVLAHCKFARMNAAGSDAELGQQVQQQMLRAIHEAIAPKMEAGQLAFKDLGMGNVAALMPEIVARSGLAQMGIAVGNLSMHFGIDGRAPQPFAAPAPAPAPAPQQVNMRVGGFNVHASSDGGIDTAGLKNQMVDKVKSTLLWWGVRHRHHPLHPRRARRLRLLRLEAPTGPRADACGRRRRGLGGEAARRARTPLYPSGDRPRVRRAGRGSRIPVTSTATMTVLCAPSSPPPVKLGPTPATSATRS